MGALRLQRNLIFNFGDLKLHDVAKFCFFKLIMMKSNFKKSVMTSWPLCHRKTSSKTSQNFSILSPPPSIKISSYASGTNAQPWII